MKEFEKELTHLINKYSIENMCDTPDFLLSEMICNLIATIGRTTKQTLDWHGTDSVCHPKKKDDFAVFTDTSDNFHPYECNKDSCIHCNMTKTKRHDPLNCVLCQGN